MFEFLLSSQEQLELVFATDVGVVGDDASVALKWRTMVLLCLAVAIACSCGGRMWTWNHICYVDTPHTLCLDDVLFANDIALSKGFMIHIISVMLKGI